MATVWYNMNTQDWATLERVLEISLEGPSEALVERYVDNVVQEIKNLVRERSDETTGELENSITGDVWDEGDGVWSGFISSSAEHAIWVEEGTGIHGPHKVPITPTYARWMVFKPRGMSKTVVAYKVEGQPGKHMFRDGLNRVIGRGGHLRRMSG